MYERERACARIFSGVSYAKLCRTLNISKVLYKVSPLENVVFSRLPFSFCLVVPIARLEIYFSPEACAELSKIPACRLARAAVYVGMQNLSLGVPSFFESHLWENICCKFNVENEETDGIADQKKYMHSFGINIPILRQEDTNSLTHFRIFMLF